MNESWTKWAVRGLDCCTTTFKRTAVCNRQHSAFLRVCLCRQVPLPPSIQPLCLFWEMSAFVLLCPSFWWTFLKSSYLLWNKKAAKWFVLYSVHTRPVANTRPIDHNRIDNSHIFCFLSNTVRRWSFTWIRCFHSAVQTAVFGLHAILRLLVKRFVCCKSRIWCFYKTESIKNNLPECLFVHENQQCVGCSQRKMLFSHAEWCSLLHNAVK